MTKIKPVTPSHSLPETFLGKEPGEIVNLIKTGTETLKQLEWLLSEIEKRSCDHSTKHAELKLIEIHRIAGIAHYLAFDIGNFLDCEHEVLRDALKAEGARHE